MSRLKTIVNSNFLELLKEDLKGEQEAIDLYQKHIDNIDIPEVKEKLIHIQNEEKEHLQELTELINKYSNK